MTFAYEWQSEPRGCIEGMEIHLSRNCMKYRSYREAVMDGDLTLTGSNNKLPLEPTLDVARSGATIRFNDTSTRTGTATTSVRVR